MANIEAPSRTDHLTRTLTLASAALCVMVGATVIAGWHLGSEVLVAVRSGFTPVGLPGEAQRSLMRAIFLTLVLGVGTAAGIAAVIGRAQRTFRRLCEFETLNYALDREVQERRQAEVSTDRLNRALRMVSACHLALAQATDESNLIRRVCELAAGPGGYRLAWIGFAEDDARKSFRLAAKAGVSSDYITDEMVTWADDDRGRSPTGAAIRTGHPARCDNVLTDPAFLPWRERALRFGLRSLLVVPLLHDGHAFGALSIYASEYDAFQAAEVELFTHLVGDLAFGIGAMRNRAAGEAAEQRIRFLASIVDTSDDAIYAQTLEGAILSWNQGALRLYGYSADEMVGKNVTVLDPSGDKDDASELLARLRSGENVERYETVRRRKDGSSVEVSLTLSAIRDPAAGIVAASSIARDITGRKRAEAELERYAEELKRSNGELQEFAVVASHDLQEPLRKITAFSERLRDRAAGQLDELSQDYLGRMHSAADRMARLIESLLDYSRVATRALPFEQVDLARLMLGVLTDLEQRVRETHAEVTIGRLPSVQGDPTQLHQLFQNLLGNALKFHAPQSLPKIAVRAQESPRKWEISVTDNGIGFDPSCVERIFRPFQRLHGRNEYEGSGMGLAICRKIAQRHGATIAVHSEPGKGSTFTVSFPAISERTKQCPEPRFESSSPRMMTTTTC
jgi:PAS domain S-box-containing protein